MSSGTIPMGTRNGTNDYGEMRSVSPSRLGKRKRSSSASLAAITTNGENITPLKQKLQDVLQIARESDSNPSILKYPLSAESLPKPNLKRTRLSSPKQHSGNFDTIENRILSGFYKSSHAVLEDLERVKIGILKDPNGSTPSSESQPKSDAEIALRLRMTQLVNLFSGTEDVLESKIKQEIKEDDEAGGLHDRNSGGVSSQILSLRSQTDKGAQQLFSGLQILRDSTDQSTRDIDGSKLPNGFELTKPNVLNITSQDLTQEKRKFGDVFRPHRNLKPLEHPRSSRFPNRGNNLEFIPQSTFDITMFPNRNDYRNTSLPAGSWLHYSNATATEPDRRRRQRERPSSSREQVSTLVTNPLEREKRAKRMFSEVYSSFAPAFDNSKAVFSANDQSSQWWQKHGQSALTSIFKPSNYEDQAQRYITSNANDEFDKLDTDFVSQEQSEVAGQSEDIETTEDMLNQISELLEALNSYQAIRSLESRRNAEEPKPSSAESDIYNLLLSQFSILVSALPPFAVAKLDGDQLRALNITTQVQIDSTEHQGTAQADDYTLRKIKAAQTATSAASRTVPLPHIRQNYQTPTSNAAVYNTNTQNQVRYNSNTNVGAGYAPKTVNYQSTRPTATPQRSYTQSSYQQTGNSYGNQTGIQQFSRPIQNGHSNYAATPSQPSLIQRPSQPGYQQRAQDSAMTYGRTTSPSKPMVNGQTPTNYPQRQYQQSVQQGYSPAQFNATLEQRAVIERVSAQNTAQSSTSAVPPASNSTNPNYDGASNQNNTGMGLKQAQHQPVEVLH